MLLLKLCLLAAAVSAVGAFLPPVASPLAPIAVGTVNSLATANSPSRMRVVGRGGFSAVDAITTLRMAAVKEEEEQETVTRADLIAKAVSKEDVEETTKKFGLEAGVFKALKGGSTQQAADLLKRYGSAYLITSITFAIISFTICYLLVDNGVDVSSLLSKVGITQSDTTETVGTFAIAYAAHKAASPIRFPPTVALTPVVAKLLGKKENEDGDEKQEE